MGNPGRIEFNHKYYNAYSDYIHRIYGERIQKVTVDAGFTCPNRDGTLGRGGCTYCNNDSFSPAYTDPAQSITRQVMEGMVFLQRRYRVRKFFVYFQPFSNTYGTLERLKACYEEALSIPQVVGLTIGTRPDCVDRHKIDYLASLARNYDITIEYGLESMFDETLKRINRGHDFQSFLKALDMTGGRGIKICTHLILGFPWETKQQWLQEAEVLSALPIDFLKIHHLHIVRGTALGQAYQEEPFELLSYDQYIDGVCSFLEKLNPAIVIQRLFGQTPAALLLAPRWGKSGSEMLHDIHSELERRCSWQGKGYRPAVS